MAPATRRGGAGRRLGTARSTAGASMFSTSVMLSGTGWWAWPTKPVTDGRVPHGGPGLVGEVHPDQDVAGKNGALDHLALAVLDLRDLLGGDHDLVDVVLHVEGDDAVLEVLPDAVLHAVVGVDDVPLAGLGPQLAAELLERVLVVRVLGGVLGGASAASRCLVPAVTSADSSSAPASASGASASASASSSTGSSATSASATGVGGHGLVDLDRASAVPRRPRRQPRPGPRRPRSRPAPRGLVVRRLSTGAETSSTALSCSMSCCDTFPAPNLSLRNCR